MLLLVAAFSVQLSAFSQEALAPAPDPVATWIGGMAADHPWLTTLAAFMGLLRLAFKPLMGLVHNFVANTSTQEDDDVLARLEGSVGFQFFAYLLDWAASIKLTKPATFQTTRLLSLALLCPLVAALGLGTGCASLSDAQRAALVDAGKLAAKVALQFGLGELGQRVNELQPYLPRLGLLIETTFSNAERGTGNAEPEAIAAQLKAHVASVVPPAHQAAVLEQLQRSAANGPQPATSAAAASPSGFRTRLAAALQ